MHETGERGPTRVAVVLSGAAARGAFQAGALAELLPALERTGMTPTILLGTSAGSINATLWASWIHLGAYEAAERLVALWSRMDHANVFAPLLTSLARPALQFQTGFLTQRGVGTSSLLDTTPLRRTAEAELDTDALAANLTQGRLSAVGVVATRVPGCAPDTVQGAASGRSVLFLQEHTRTPNLDDPARALDVVHCRLRADHVLASAAIPIAFPAQHITEPAEATGWYVDGGVRLNTPLRPALRLGATHLVVIAANTTTYAPAPPPDTSSGQPDIADAGAQVLHAVLADRMVEDLLEVRRTNRLVEQVRTAAPAGRTATLDRSDGEPYRKVHLLTVSPPPGRVAHLADDVYTAKTSGARALREVDLTLLGRLLRGLGDSTGRRELLSYLLFDEDYFRQSIELGRAVARDALCAGWQT